MQDYFVTDNYNNVKSFTRLRDAREHADAIVGYNPGWMITSLDYSDYKTRFIASKNFDWFRTSRAIQELARKALIQEKARIRNAIFADVESVINFVKIAAIDNEEETLRRLCVFALRSDEYRMVKISYCCDDRDVAELCREVIKGTRVERVLIETVNKARGKREIERARIDEVFGNF